MNVKIKDNLYPASVVITDADPRWNKRETADITLEMDAAQAAELFVDDVVWGVESDGVVEDMSDYCIAGSIRDHRDGTVTVTMEKATDAELLAIIMGG